MTTLSLIAAMAGNRVIGRNNQLPWRLPADLAHFKKLTLGKPVIMGRKTFESLGRPLPERLNIVISSNPFLSLEGATVTRSLEDAIALAKETRSDEIMIIGGSQIFTLALPIAQKIYLTVIEHDFEGDSYFPELPEGQWQETSNEPHEADEKNPYSYRFVIYQCCSRS